MSDIDLLLFGCSEDARREPEPQLVRAEPVRAEPPRGRRVPNEVA